MLVIRGIPQSWVETYLRGREQRVKMPYMDSQKCKRWAKSSSAPVLRSVTQESMLRPVLFLLFINYFHFQVFDDNNRVYLFADNTSLSLTSDSRQLEEFTYLSQTCVTSVGFRKSSYSKQRKHQCFRVSHNPAVY